MVGTKDGGNVTHGGHVLRADVGIRPYGVYRGWYEIVGTTIGRPFIIAYGDAGRGTRPLQSLFNLGAGL